MSSDRHSSSPKNFLTRKYCGMDSSEHETNSKLTLGRGWPSARSTETNLGATSSNTSKQLTTAVSTEAEAPTSNPMVDEKEDALQRRSVAIEQWLKKRKLDKQRAKERWIESYRANARKDYAAKILEEEGRAVRAYQPSTPERRRLQKAASRERQKAKMTPEDLANLRKRERERKALERGFKRMERDVEQNRSCSACTDYSDLI
jgi:hypothetical protein